MADASVSLGSVFVSYAHEDVDRVRPLVDYLVASGLPVWWDEKLEAGTTYRMAIEKALGEASCVVVLWTAASIQSRFVLDEVGRVEKKGILVPAFLDAGLQPPLGFGQFQYLDLSGWTGGDNPQLTKLVSRARSLVALGPSQSFYQQGLTEDNWTLNNSRQIVSNLRGLTQDIRHVGDLLTTGTPAVQDLRGALDEVGKTYRVVNDAILNFIMPAVEGGPINPKPYVEMERGSLITAIRAGHGHCGLILTYYFRYGGLRDAVKGKLGQTDLANLDNTFSQLGTADGDLFRPLEQIGDLLTSESRVVANLLLAEQDKVARQRILDGRLRLSPLEQDLTKAMQELQELESSLGYVDRSGSAAAPN